MPDDLLDIFETSLVEGGDQDTVEVLSRNANVHMGDDDGFSLDESDDDSEVDEDLDIDNDETDVDDDGEVVEDATDEFDFDSIKDKSVEVTVNGETFKVPLTELRNGYMRQADYTRKTQQVAADADTIRWAREMQEAFRVDPAGSIRYLQEQFGYLDEPDPLADVDPEMQPIVAELWRTQQQLVELQQKQEQLDQERVNNQVRAELDQMKSRYPDFDPLEVLPIAIDNGLTMETAYKIWKADRVEAESETQRVAREKAEKAAVQREKARRAKSQTTRSKGMVAEVDDSWKKFDSFEDIFAYEFERTRS